MYNDLKSELRCSSNAAVIVRVGMMQSAAVHNQACGDPLYHA